MSKFRICCDFNVHHKEWPVRFSKIDVEGIYCRDFTIAYVLTQIIEESTRGPGATGQQANFLHISISSSPDESSLTHQIIR